MGEGSTVNASQCYDSSHVGKNNRIGPFTHVRPGTVTQEGVHLGAYVETKNVNFAEGNTVSHLTYIGDADVGKYCNFGCGTVTCNYDGEGKFRTTIGDYAFIGCNTNLVAPVKVGDHAYTAAGSTIGQRRARRCAGHRARQAGRHRGLGRDRSSRSTSLKSRSWRLKKRTEPLHDGCSPICPKENPAVLCHFSTAHRGPTG